MEIAERLTPVSAGERIEVLDILRGFALFGILAVNMRGFNTPLAAWFDPGLMWNDPLNRTVQDFITALFTYKFITIFSFLFGIGFAIQLTRAKRKQVSPAGVYLRRLTVLLAIGLAHGLLLWAGDILGPYAVMGFFLFLFRNRSPRTLLIWAVILFIWPFLPNVLLMLAVQSGAPVQLPQQSSPEELERIVQVFSSGAFGEIFRERLKELAFVWTGLFFFYPRVLAILLLGLYTWRSGLMENLAGKAAFLRRCRGVGLWVGLPLSVVGVVAARVWDAAPYSGTPASVAVDLAISSGAPLLSMFYAATITLASLTEDGRGRLRSLAAAGRMALTNYLLQTLICTLLFQSWGFGLYGKVGPAWGLLLTVLIYTGQLALSVWWMRRFTCGPAEWLWRTLTYLQPQPMRS